MRPTLAAILVVAALTPVSLAVQSPQPLSDPAIDRRVDALLKQMTLEEKLGQLNQLSGGDATGPATAGRRTRAEMIAAGEIGSLLNVTGARETNDLQRVAMTRSRLKIPILFGLDVIHGYRTIFPVPLALASTWNPELVEHTARAAAREASSEGVRWTFSPMVDIARDARWGRIVEGAGEDPYLGAVLAAAYVKGYQGPDLGAPDAIAACAKHYVGYGAAEGGRDYNTTEIPERLLRDVYLPPFKAAVEAGAATLMSAFNAINGVPATANRFTLDQVLRREWGFRGFVVSDWGSIGEMMAHGIANDGATAARKALEAGVDMDMESRLYLGDLANEVKSGRVPMASVDEAVRRVLRVKMALGLFERPYTEERPAPAPVESQVLSLAREAAEASFVLLKNDGRQGRPAPLPLAASARVALIGPLADSRADMLGTWSAKGRPEDVVTLRSALTAALGAERVVYEKGIGIADGDQDGIAAAVAAARTADVVLLALGENATWMTGEAASRASLSLPGLQEQLVQEVVAVGKPVVLLLFTGRPLALAPVVDLVDAVVQAWHPGVQAGPALVNVLTGRASFSGRLTVSFPRSVGQLPLYYNHLNTGRPADRVDQTRPPRGGDDKYVSRYIDERNAPLFPFGYGLSYTRFEYSAPQVSASSVMLADLEKEPISVTVQVKNTGARAGAEVVQFYVAQRGTSVARPVRDLKGFQRVRLEPGESRVLKFSISRDTLAFWTLDKGWTAEPADVSIWVAPHAAAGTPARFTVR